MEKIQRKLKKFSQVMYVFARIACVASIIGLCLCAAAIIWGLATGNPLKSLTIGGSSIFLMSMGEETNLAVIYGALAHVLTVCIFMIIITRVLMRLFANMRDHYTPFTMENAMLFKRTAILMIVAAIVPVIVGQSVGKIVSMALSLPFSADYSDGFSLIVVLAFFAMSIVFQYGCALQEQADTTL